MFVFCWQVHDADTIWAFVWDAPTQAADIGGACSRRAGATPDRLWKAAVGHHQHRHARHAAGDRDRHVPVAFLAARNTTPSVLFVRPMALFIIVSSRSINSLIWALLLVIVSGPGVLAGIIAIALRSIGFIGKLLYEAIEEIDETQVEAVDGHRRQRRRRCSPTASCRRSCRPSPGCVFRWDINIREATVLGLVGAGGIGMQLQASLNTLAWPQVRADRDRRRRRCCSSACCSRSARAARPRARGPAPHPASAHRERRGRCDAGAACAGPGWHRRRSHSRGRGSRRCQT
jgi:phosphonate transport system permease protein